MEWLLKHGADSDISNSDGWYPIQYALRGHIRTVAIILLKYGANPDLISESFRARVFDDGMHKFIERYRQPLIKEPGCE
jgi:hypothetical protein